MVAALLVPAPAHAGRRADAGEFYKGRNVNLIIGYSPGGGYDLYGRVLAQHMSKHIPGNPKIIPQNMPGAGSLKAANYLFSAAPKDGTVIGTFARSTGINPQLVGHGDVRHPQVHLDRQRHQGHQPVRQLEDRRRSRPGTTC